MGAAPRSPTRTQLLCTLLAASACTARECGQKELDAHDIAGCTSLRHMDHLGHGEAVWLGDALAHNAR